MTWNFSTKVVQTERKKIGWSTRCYRGTIWMRQLLFKQYAWLWKWYSHIYGISEVEVAISNSASNFSKFRLETPHGWCWSLLHQTFSSFCLRGWRIVACTNIEKVLNWGYHIALGLNLRHFIIWHTQKYCIPFFHTWANSSKFHTLRKPLLIIQSSYLPSGIRVSNSKRYDSAEG